MRAIAGGTPFPLWYTKRHTQSDTHSQRIPGVQSDSSEPEGTKTCTRSLLPPLRQEGKKLGSYEHTLQDNLTHESGPRMSHSQLGSSHVLCQRGGSGYIRCDWETILVRLRPRESTWLETLLAVDRGCLVRTRPVRVCAGKTVKNSS